jgi:hypothetical protein
MRLILHFRRNQCSSSLSQTNWLCFIHRLICLIDRLSFNDQCLYRCCSPSYVDYFGERFVPLKNFLQLWRSCVTRFLMSAMLKVAAYPDAVSNSYDANDSTMYLLCFVTYWLEQDPHQPQWSYCQLGDQRCQWHPYCSFLNCSSHSFEKGSLLFNYY